VPLPPGTRLGPYEIVGPLGAGGMGEVFRATDTRLGRDVAIKALPAAFAQDPERLARFEREAKLLASLSHPNVAVLYGLEEVQGARYLALEFIEGETLASRLARGALPLEEALEVARQIAAGVEAAHESDVVHRDLKPGNVMLSSSGAVKVLDFGLARSGAGDRPGSDPKLSASPTMTYAATEAGVILGTAAYMSPEQARGKSVDKRTDIWSFGCVLYECLTGRQAFAGETVSDIVACILQTEPEWSALPTSTPQRVRSLLARCLEKDVKRRLRDIGDARIEIEEVLATRRSASGAARVAAPARARSMVWPAIAIIASITALGALLGPRLLVRPTPPPPMRFEVRAPKGRFLGDGSSISISPDGRLLAMIASDSSGRSSLWVRKLEDLTPRELPGTEGVTMMFWSPDSRRLGFFANDQALSKIAVENGTPERICDTKAARGGAWGADGTILFAPYSNGGIFRVSAGGGVPVQITRPDSAHGVTGHRFPVLLPDGKHFLFTAIPNGPDGKLGLCVGTMDGGPTREIARCEAGVAWAGSGWLLTARSASLVAWRFDERRLECVGDPVSIGDPLVGTSNVGSPVVSVSRDGALAYLTREDVPRRAEWYDFEKQQVAGKSPLPAGFYDGIRLAPNERRALVVRRSGPRSFELLLTDLERGVSSVLSEPGENPEQGVWSRDGTRIAYLIGRDQSIRVRSLVDGSQQTYLENDPSFKNVDGFTPDGKALLIARLDPATKWDLWLLPLDGGPPRALLNTPANELFGEISGDGRWLGFLSDESGITEVYLAPLTTPGLKYQVTIGGGDDPDFGLGGFFSDDGKRLYFRQSKEPGVNRVAEIIAEPALSLGPSRIAFRFPNDLERWSTTRDRRRLIRLVSTEKSTPQAVTILQHWESALRKP